LTPEVVADVRRGAGRLAHRLRMERPTNGLAATKLAVLVHLNTHGPSSPTDVAVAERQLPQSLTRSFGELEADGLIKRTMSGSDARRSVLSITADGVAALAEDMASRDEWLARAMGELSDLEVQILHLGATIMDRIA
jgi:DNA-binding MarR family transcriptional regulator